MYFILYFRRLSSSTGTPHRDCTCCLSRQRQANVHERRKFFENSHASRATWKNVQRRTNTSKSTLLRSRKDEVRPVTSTEHGEITLSWRRVCTSTDDKLCCSFLSVYFQKIVKRKTRKRECWFCGVVGRAPSAVID